MLVCAALLTGALHAAAVNVTGTGNIGIGVINGGVNQFGLTDEQLRQLMKATGRDQARLISELVNKMNAQAAREVSGAKQAAFTEGVVRQFLATLLGKQIAPNDYPQAFGDLTRRFLDLETQIKAIPVVSDKVGELISKVEKAKQAGRFDEADLLLAQAVDAALAYASQAQVEMSAANRRVARILAARGSLALLRLERDLGAELLFKAFNQQLDEISSESMSWLFEAGEAWSILGNSAAALNVFQIANSSARTALQEGLGSRITQGDLLLSYIKIGETQLTQGDTAAALKS